MSSSKRSTRANALAAAASFLLIVGIVVPLQKASDFTSYFNLQDGNDVWSDYFQGSRYNATIWYGNDMVSQVDRSFNKNVSKPDSMNVIKSENKNSSLFPENLTANNQTGSIVAKRPSGNDTSSDQNSSMILTFVTIEFVQYIDFWYSRLTELGYTEHVVAAWDEKTYQHCQTKGWRTIRCISTGQKGPKSKNQEYRRSLFAARWHCVNQQLQAGHNILLTDVDNTFQRYVPLSSFEKYNVIHAFGGGYPPRHLKRHGFTVCGGMTWLQSAPQTLKYVGMVLDECKTRCDDQGKINNMFSTLNISWTVQPLEQQLPSNHNWPEPAGSRSGISAVTGHSVMIWDTGFAFRGPLSAVPCPTNPWVAMPVNLNGKKVHDQWQSKCPPPMRQNSSVHSENR